MIGVYGHYRALSARLCALVVAGFALAVRSEEPRWLRVQIPEASVSTEIESTTEETKVGSGSSTYEHLFITPLIGLRTHGSVYHPNLLSFDLNGESGWGWDSTTSKSSGSNQTRNNSQELLRYYAQVNILSTKPYNASFYASQDHTFRDYGTFSTFTVDSTRYGGRLNWRAGKFILSTDMSYRDEQSSGLYGSSEITETYFNFTGIHQRKSSQTTLTYRLNQFDNQQNLGASQSSFNHVVGISDSETFGSRKQIIASTGLSYGQSRYGGQDSETVTANENITIHHRPKLDSYFSLDTNLRRYGPADSSRVQGVYGVRHQLYESLTSNLDAHGNYEEHVSGASSASNDRYGVGVFERYTKKLRSWGRLTIGIGTVADHLDYDSSGGVITTIDEPHTLYSLASTNTYSPVYLNQPRVIASTVVVRGTGGVSAQLNTDYELISAGELTEIRLVQGSLTLHDGDAVTVTYQSESVISAAFESLNASTEVRLDLFGRLGIYGRINRLENNAPPEVLTQTLTDKVGGVDFNWRWFRAGAEYEDYDSNFIQYQAWRFNQNIAFHPGEDSSLSFAFNQTFYRYSDDRSQDQYQFLSRYNLQLLTSLAWYVEGGYAIQEVLGTEQLLASAKTGLTWSRGKLSIRTGYEFNSQNTSSDRWTQERVRHRFYAYLKRTF